MLKRYTYFQAALTVYVCVWCAHEAHAGSQMMQVCDRPAGYTGVSNACMYIFIMRTDNHGAMSCISFTLT